MQKSFMENVGGAFLSILSALLTIAAAFFVNHIFTKGLVLQVPIPANLQLNDQAREMAVQALAVVAMPVVFYALLSNVSRAASHTTPDWKAFWYIESIPSFLFAVYVVLAVPILMWVGVYNVPDIALAALWGTFILHAATDLGFNGKHRVEHRSSPLARFGGQTVASTASRAAYVPQGYAPSAPGGHPAPVVHEITERVVRHDYRRMADGSEVRDDPIAVIQV
jgi:hypothetical protein